jgi:hypothetical protein
VGLETTRQVTGVSREVGVIEAHQAEILDGVPGSAGLRLAPGERFFGDVQGSAADQRVGAKGDSGRV